MIMISSNSTQRVGKPPPPIPPRPSKSVVAEALAKSRHHNKVISIREAEKTKSPTRQAPPPPMPRSEIAKSKSSYSINIPLKKPPVYERSISEEVKKTSRPVIYQSSNVKCNNNSVQITKEESGVKIVNNGVHIVRRPSKLEEESRNRIQVSRKESVNRDKFCGEEFVGRCVISEGNDANDAKSKSTTSTLEKSSSSSDKNGSCNSLDKGNWDQMLHDRNHVNTLIDEMFASVLEVQFNDGKSAPDQNDNKQSNSLSRDKTEIIITDANDYENVKFDNGVIVNSGEIVKMDDNNIPKTVIVIKNDSSDMEDEREKNKNFVSDASNTSSAERPKQVKFKDQLNHELLINELQCMKQDQEKILKRQRKPSMNIYDDSEVPNSENNSKISRPDWIESSDEEREVKLNTCHIEINDDPVNTDEKKAFSLDYERITKMSSLHGLPPLPKSLSGFSLLETHQAGVNPPTPMRSSSIRSSSGQQIPPGHLVYPPHPKVNGEAVPQIGGGTAGRKSTNLDAQLAILRREMVSQIKLNMLI